MTRRLELFFFLAVLVVSVVAAYAIGHSAATGLSARFWANADWAGPPVGEQAHSLPDIDHFIRGVPRLHATGGSAEWTGVLFVDQPGEYEFETLADDQAWLFVGAARVIDYGDDRRGGAVQGRVTLTRGAHPLRIRYTQRDGAMALQVFWSGPGLARHLLRAEEVAPRAALEGTASERAWIRAAAVAVPVAWALLLIYLAARFAGVWLWRDVARVAPDIKNRRALAAVLASALVLTVWGLTWGLDGAWAPDELSPGLVRELIDRRFGDGWFDKYPVMHYVLVSIPVSAFEIASRLGLLPSDSLASYLGQLAMMRLVSVLMGIGTLIAVFLCAAELYGPRRAVLAAWCLLLTGLFVFYGKVANLDVPFMFWFGLAMLGFLRIWTRNRTADYVLLGAAAAAAVATKDQAYASLALLPIGVIASNMRSSSAVAWWRRLLAALGNRRMLLGGVVSALTFVVCHNVVFNFGGVVEHFRLLSTLGDLAIAPRTLAGYLSLTTLTGELFRFALGWPLLLAALGGIATAAWHRDRRWWLWLLLVPLSFTLTFTFVTMYVNDRYLFGGVFVTALFAGSFLADALDRWRSRAGGRAVVAGVLGYSLLYAGSVNVMMLVDSRKAVRPWLEAHGVEGQRVGVIGSYMPEVGPAFRPVNLRAERAAVAASMPEWLVLNGRYASRFEKERSPLGRELMAALADGSLGYVEVSRHRGALPGLALLQYDPQFSNSRESTWTNLDKINPEVILYRIRQ